MNRFKKWVKKDRYGVVRGTLLLCVVMVLCNAMVIRLFFRYESEVGKERAGFLAQYAASVFEQHIDDGMLELHTAAEMVAEPGADEAAVLDMLVKSSDLTDVVVFRDGISANIDGTKIELDAVLADSYRYENDSLSGDIMLLNGGFLKLCISRGEELAVAGTLDIERLVSDADNILTDEYGCAIYNSGSGEYLFDHLPFDDEALRSALTVEDGAEAQLEEINDGSEDYWVARRETRIPSFYVTLALPADMIQHGSGIPFAITLAAALMILILVSYTILSLRRVRISNRNAARALDVGERMMEVISGEAGITLFVYQRKHNALLYFNDGLSILNDGGLPRIHSIEEIEDACGMDEAEAEKLHEYLREIKPGENFEMLCHTMDSNREERVLRFTLCALSETDAGIICSISDCTREQESLNRIELEQRYLNSVRSKTSSIWQVNVSRNRWKLLYARKKAAFCGALPEKECWRDYDADVDGCLKDYLHPADYSWFVDEMNTEKLVAMFRSGKTECVHDYRVRINGTADSEWHRMRVRIWLNPKSNDIFANMYVFDVTQEKNAELERGEHKKMLHQSLVALGAIYNGLFYVDLENDLSYTARSLGGDLVSQLCAPYKATVAEYVDSIVHPEDRDKMHALLSAYQLRRNMTEGSHFRRVTFRRKVGDGYENAAIIVQPARFENGIVREVVLAIQYTGCDQNS